MDENTSRCQPPVSHPTACPVLAALLLGKKEEDSELNFRTLCGRNSQVSRDGSRQRLNTNVASSPQPVSAATLGAMFGALW